MRRGNLGGDMDILKELALKIEELERKIARLERRIRELEEKQE